MSVAVENPEDALRAALSAPFAPNHIPRAVAQTPAQSEQDVPNAPSKHITRSTELDAEATAARDESWKAEYDRHLSGWREESAVRREAAEKERERWEKLKQGQGNRASAFPMNAPNPTDARGFVPGEREGGHGIEGLNQALLAPSANQQTTQHPSTVSGSGDEPTTSSQTWEQVGSAESSYPSLSFPDTPPHAPPLSPQAFRAPNPPPPPPVHPPSVTLSIFDSSLSRRARILALVSSLTINLLLPFINGVMLGFGEIFARHLIKWKGWNNVASFVGLGSPSPLKSEAYPPPLSGPPPRRPRFE